MQQDRNIALLQQRRAGIRQWLEDEAPYTESDQRHLDANTPERAYWHHGYQAALADVIGLLAPADLTSGSADTSK
jgi:ribosome modulation factor